MKHSLIKLSTILFFIFIFIACNKENPTLTILYKIGNFEIAIDDSVDNTKYLWLDYYDKKQIQIIYMNIIKLENQLIFTIVIQKNCSKKYILTKEIQAAEY